MHRIGRTARANRTGTAYTFFTHDNLKQARDLIKVIQEAGQPVNPRLHELANESRDSSGSRKFTVSLIQYTHGVDARFSIHGH